MEESKKRTLKERFQDKGFSVTAYASSRNLDRSILYKVLDGYVNGKKTGKSKQCVEQLRIDDVWDDEIDGKELTYDPDKRSA